MSSKKKLTAGGEEDESGITLTVNKKFAEQYAKKKKNEELSRLQDKYNAGELESDSDESDEDEGELLTGKVVDELSNVLGALKRKDPAIYDPNIQFYAEDDSDDQKDEGDEADPLFTEKGGKKKKEKPMYLKDYEREQILKGNVGAQSDSESEREKDVPLKDMAPVAQQEWLRKDFLAKTTAEQASDDEGDFLSLRSGPARAVEEASEEEEETAAAAPKKAGKKTKNKGKDAWKDKMSTYFDAGDKEDENEAFLKDFVLNEKWKDKDAGRIPTYQEIVEDDSEEEDLADLHEKRVNFRFEEEGANEVIGHARNVEGTLRRKDERRKTKREEKTDRLKKERLQREEELKRLKNLKTEEIRRKLQTIYDNAGASGAAAGVLTEEDLEKDFNPDEFDAKMQAMFDEDTYYQGDEDDKPEFDVHDDDDWFAQHHLDLGDEGGDDDGESKRDKKKRRKDKKKKRGGEEVVVEYDEDGNPVEGGDDEDDVLEAAARLAKEEGRMDLDQMLDEYYKLHHEDAIGDVKTRFRYATCAPEGYGMTVDDILDMDDKYLNEAVSLKLMSPYHQTSKADKLRKKFRTVKQRWVEARKHGGAEAPLGEAGEGEEAVPAPSKNKLRKKRKREAEEAARKASEGGEDGEDGAAVAEEEEGAEAAEPPAKRQKTTPSKKAAAPVPAPAAAKDKSAAGKQAKKPAAAGAAAKPAPPASAPKDEDEADQDDGVGEEDVAEGPAAAGAEGGKKKRHKKSHKQRKMQALTKSGVSKARLATYSMAKDFKS